MDKIKKMGEITCEIEDFEIWVRETLENSGFQVRIIYDVCGNATYEIYSK